MQVSFWNLWICLFLIVTAGCSSVEERNLQLLHVSYDPTREFFSAYNDTFTEHWQLRTGQRVVVHQSHGGSGTQARSVIHGLQADMVSLALALDIDEIARQTDLLPTNWQQRLPNNSIPYTSVVVFLVRKGNPKGVHNWGDLIQDDLAVVMPNPKTSGGARWGYLAAYGYALEHNQGNEDLAHQYMKQLYQHVPLLDTGARAAATTFTQRRIGDVLVTWENEAYLILKELENSDYEIVMPSLSIRAEPPVAWIDGNVENHHTRTIAEAYLNGLYTNESQELAAKHFLRPVNPEVLQRYRKIFPEVRTLSIDDFGGWQKAQAKHFSDGGLFDQLHELGVP